MRYSATAYASLLSLGLAGCAGAPSLPPTARPSAPASGGLGRGSSPLDGARQAVVVVTATWESTSGSLQRYERDDAGESWRPVATEVPIVVGQTGLAWDESQQGGSAGAPLKREGDGKAPAGAFALDTAFGFSIRQTVPWIRLPYLQLRTTTECVDDPRSAHYNTIVDRSRVGAVDWSSSERMREIEQYAFGVHVAYNAAPRRAGRGSCIFLHIWAGPGSVTAGCTAMEQGALEQLLRWLDPSKGPVLVQLPRAEHARLRARWGLP